MKTLITTTILLAACSLLLAGCKNKQMANSDDGGRQPVGVSMGTLNQDKPLTGWNNLVPKARIYRTNGNYNDNVPIQVAADGTTVISFPAPSDLSTNSEPLLLADGFLLDRRGVGVDSRFTTYTYAQYAALPEPPSIEQLLHSIIPEACITELVELPLTNAEAMADTAAVNNLIHTGLPGCNFIIQAPAEK